MKILYMSHILSIHDSRFLKKLLSSNHDVLLVAIDNSNIPESISSIEGLKHIVIPRPLPKNNFKYYLSFQAIILLLTHGIYMIIEKFSYFKSYFSDTTKISHQEFRFFFYRTKILQIIKKFKPDVLHAGWVQLDGLVAELTGFRPILQMPWGSDILIFPFNSEQILMQTKFVLNGATQITCDCDEVKKTIIDLVSYDKDKITVMPWGIDLKLFNPERKNPNIIKKLDWQDKRIIIMTRSFNEIYGIPFFLMALPKIIKSEGRVRVILVGTGPLEEDLKEIVNSLDLDQYVHFAGLVPNDQLAFYLNLAEVYISTSKSDGASLSLLEAMACGLPLVVSDVPAICEWVTDGENGYLVPRGKVNPISEKILALLNDRALAQKMGNINLSIVNERADLEKNYPQIDSIYEQMVQSEN